MNTAVRARFNLGFDLAIAMFLVQANLLRAGEEFTLTSALAAAEKGDVKAAYWLGKRYGKGDGVTWDDIKAVEYLRQSAEQGYAPAQNDYAAALANGMGVKQDFCEAARWFGQSEALLVFGDVYLNGAEGFKQDYAESFKWFQRAVEHGQLSALNSLGYLYEHGFGVARNPEQAMKCFYLASEGGDARGQMNLGRMYQTGCGIEKNLVEAYKWFQIALMGGELTAKHYLVEMQMQQAISDTQIAEAKQRLHDYLEAHKLPARSAEEQSSTRLQ